MERRQYITALGTAFAVTAAGCSSSDSSTTTTADTATTTTTTQSSTSVAETTQTTKTTTETTTQTTTAEPASFELVNLDAPSQVEIGTTATWSFTVKNTGGQTGTFETTVSTKESSDYSWSTSEDWTATVKPGNTHTFESQEFSLPYMTTVKLRLDTFNKTTSISFVSRKLQFGESFTNGDQVKVTVTNLEAKAKYHWSSNGYTYTETPENGQYIFAHVKAHNNAGKPIRIPTKYDFAIVANHSQYDATYYQGTDGYEGGKVQADIIREGVVVFDVPESVSPQSAQFVYSDTTLNGDIAVYWS